jgi:S-methylmethionine-dependent homocysteine/selenocysteine methylase
MTGSRTLAAVWAEPVVLLSGACGTELERRGAPTPLPLWSAAAVRDAPALVGAIHREHVEAGARVVTANTFRTDRRTMARAGLGREARSWTKAAVALAREAVLEAAPGRPVAVAGSIAPLEDCYRPDLVPDDATLRGEHGIKAGNLAAAGVDLALVETMNTAREAVAALGACAAAGLPAAAAFVCGPGARLLSGEPVAEAVAAVLAAGPPPLALLVNCCAPAVAVEALAAVRAAAPRVRCGTYPNGAGAPDAGVGWRFDRAAGTDLEAFLEGARRAVALGASVLGGCCGTTPEHVRALARLLAEDGRGGTTVSD